jgi:hypothetical protein
MVRRSASIDSLSQVSLTGASTTPELLDEEEKEVVSEEKMQGNYGSAFLLHACCHMSCITVRRGWSEYQIYVFCL